MPMLLDLFFPGCACCGQIATPCCTAPLQLTATISAKTGTCTCLPNAVILTYDGASNSWVGSFTACGGTFTISLGCFAPPNDCTSFKISNVFQNTPITTCSCGPPISLVYTLVGLIPSCCTGTCTVTITP